MKTKRKNAVLLFLHFKKNKDHSNNFCFFSNTIANIWKIVAVIFLISSISQRDVDQIET